MQNHICDPPPLPTKPFSLPVFQGHSVYTSQKVKTQTQPSCVHMNGTQGGRWKKKPQSPLHHFTAGKGWFLILNYYRRTISVWRQTCSGTTRATWILLSTLPKCGPGKFTCMRPYPLWDILTKSHNNEWYELWRTSWQNCHGSIPSQNIVIPQAWRAKETDHHHQQP